MSQLCLISTSKVKEFSDTLLVTQRAWELVGLFPQQPLLYTDPDGETYRVCQVGSDEKETNCTEQKDELTDKQQERQQRNAESRFRQIRVHPIHPRQTRFSFPSFFKNRRRQINHLQPHHETLAPPPTLLSGQEGKSVSSRQLRKLTRKISAAAGPIFPDKIQKPTVYPDRHELFRKAHVLGNERHDRFAELASHYIERFQPADEVEMDLIDDMISARWRLQRIWTMQTAGLELQMDRQEEEIKKTFTRIDHATYTTVAFTTLANTDKALQLMLRLETTLNRMYNRALKTLQELQKHRPKPAESRTSEILRNDPKPSEPAPRKSPAVDLTKPQPIPSEPAMEPDNQGSPHPFSK
jgi:hypothetical protein